MISIRHLILLWLVVATLTPRLVADVIYVNASATGANSGTNWTDAFTDLQDALAVANPGDEIWVAAGTYRPGPMNGPRTSTFQLKSGVAVFGGFAGVESNLSERDWIANETILCGDLAGNDRLVSTSDCCISHAGAGCDDALCQSSVCVLDSFCCITVWDGECATNAQDICTLVCPSDHENSHHVVTSPTNGQGSVLDGFTITEGNATGLVGGGVFVLNPPNSTVSVALRNCVVDSNYAEFGGGGLGVVSFTGNPDATIYIDNVSFSRNRASLSGGGAIYAENAIVIVANSEFCENEAIDSGGGVLRASNTHVTLENCKFNGNRSAGTGGVLLITNSSQLYMQSCMATNNVAAWAGGVGLLGNITAEINNCIFARNSATYGGGLEIEENTDLAIDGCTIVGNEAIGSSPGGGVHGTVGGFGWRITNSIFWNNTSQGVQSQDAQLGINSGTPVISFSCVEGLTGSLGGIGNTGEDPIFVGEAAGDFHLNSCSPLVNAGAPGFVPDPGETDIDGDPRVIGGRVDIGADEVDYIDADMDGFPDNCSSPGSCCKTDGTCSLTLQGGCVGNWTVGGTCAPNTCPQPGSCCANDGTCAVGFESSCLLGEWTQGGSCNPNVCPQPGSCCEAQETCSITLQANCAGPWTLGGTCDPAPCITPFAAAAAGSRYLSITVDPMQAVQPLALKITSPDFPCLVAYVGTGGLIGASPFFQTPAAWGTVYVGDDEIVPSTTYTVQTETANGLSGVIETTTWRWGDANNSGAVDLDDILCELAAFGGAFTPNCTLYGADMIGSFFNPDRAITLDDILAVLSAFGGQAYPGQGPCP